MFKSGARPISAPADGLKYQEVPIKKKKDDKSDDGSSVAMVEDVDE
jgi:hypothetical protein